MTEEKTGGGPLSGMNADISVKADTKDAADVFTRLLDVMSAGVGKLYEPTHIKRIAKAEAQAAVTKADAEGKALIVSAKAGVAVEALQRRALERFVQQETRKQENLESIVEGAKDKLDANGSPEKIDPDWLNEFADRASKVSDKQLQELWSKILAGEANQPKSFRKAAISKLAELEKEDLEMFMSVCRFVWMIGKPTPLIMKASDDFYRNRGVTFSVLTHLDDIGLISFNNVMSLNRLGLPKEFGLGYAGEIYKFELTKDKGDLPAGHADFTLVGEQLFGLAKVQKIPQFPQYLADYYKNFGIKMTGPGIATPDEIGKASP